MKWYLLWKTRNGQKLWDGPYNYPGIAHAKGRLTLCEEYFVIPAISRHDEWEERGVHREDEQTTLRRHRETREAARRGPDEPEVRA